MITTMREPDEQFNVTSAGRLTHDTRCRRLYWLAVVTEGDELVVKPDAGIQPEMTGHQDILVLISTPSQ